MGMNVNVRVNDISMNCKWIQTMQWHQISDMCARGWEDIFMMNKCALVFLGASVLQVKPSKINIIDGTESKMYTYGCFKALSGYFTNILPFFWGGWGGAYTQARSGSFPSLRT